MKLQSRKNKTKTIVLIAIIAILLIAVVGVVVGWLFTNNDNTVGGNNENEIIIEEIVLSVLPKNEYYIGEEFDATNLRIQVVTNNVDTTYFIDYPSSELRITGFDSTTAGEKVITVQYKEFTTTFNVLIKNYEGDNPIPTNIEVQDMFLEYTLEEWQSWGPSELNAWLLITYSDGSTKGSLEETPLRRSYITGWDPTYTYTHGETQITITYTEDGITVYTTVTITITE